MDAVNPPMACLHPRVTGGVFPCPEEERRCATQPFFVQLEHPPWFHCPPKCPVFRKPLTRRTEYDYELNYDFQKDYLPPNLLDKALPTVAFYFYADQVPDPPVMSRGVVTRDTISRVPPTWPPLEQGVCPPPQECEPCGPGPWANPEARKFFYMECQ